MSRGGSLVSLWDVLCSQVRRAVGMPPSTAGTVGWQGSS